MKVSFFLLNFKSFGMDLAFDQLDTKFSLPEQLIFLPFLYNQGY